MSTTVTIQRGAGGCPLSTHNDWPPIHVTPASECLDPFYCRERQPAAALRILGSMNP